MPKATDIPQVKRSPVSVEKMKQAKGENPYADGNSRAPVAIPLSADIPQFAPPSRFPDPEVMLECLHRGVEDRGFSFGVGGQWGTTWKRAKELAGQTKIIKIYTPDPDA